MNLVTTILAKTLFKAEQKASNFLLNGKKTFVIDGASADIFIVLARTSGNSGDLAGLTLFVVEAEYSMVLIKSNSIWLIQEIMQILSLIMLNASKGNILGTLEAGGEIR